MILKINLLVVDHYTKYIELEKLNSDTTSSSVINKFKYIFARHGIPAIVATVGGLEFSSKIFKTFSNDWNFTHIISSPIYVESNGMVKRHIQTTKNNQIPPKQQSPGPDQIPNIIIKNLSQKALVQLTYIINSIFKLRLFPNPWKTLNTYETKASTQKVSKRSP